jgi:hypothetical protein
MACLAYDKVGKQLHQMEDALPMGDMPPDTLPAERIFDL